MHPVFRLKYYNTFFMKFQVLKPETGISEKMFVALQKMKFLEII